MAKQYENLVGELVDFNLPLVKTAAALPTRSVLARRKLRQQRRTVRAL